MKHPSLYDRIAKLFAPFKPKRSRGEARMAGIVGPYNSSRFGPRTWDKYTQVRAYRSWVYRCVEFICQGTRLPPDIVTVTEEKEREQYERAMRQWKRKGFPGAGPVRRKFLSNVKRKGVIGPVKPFEEYEYLPNDHPAVRLVNDPNEPYTGLKFWQLVGTYEELTGESFIWVVENGAGQPVELWVLPSQWVTPRNDGRSDKLVDYFEVRAQNAPMEIFNPEEIIWSKNDNPWHPLYVTSRIQTASTTIDAYDMTETARYAGLENGVLSGGAITVPPDVNVPADIIDRLETRFQAKNAGPTNSMRPMILEGGLQWTPPEAAAELAYMQSEDQLRRFIMAQFGLDESMMGFANFSTYAAAVITDNALRTRVFGTRLEDRAATLTERLLPRFGTDLRCIYSPTVAMDDPDAKRADWELAHNAGAVTKNEIRTELLGLEPSDEPGADELPQDLLGGMGMDGGMGWDEEGGDVERPGFSTNGKHS